MSWESRKGNGRYYTRSRRHNGRVEREYFGCGTTGVLAERFEALAREKRQMEAEALRAEQTRTESLDAEVASVCKLADLFAQAALLAAGYHQHHRGTWRKRREQNNEK